MLHRSTRLPTAVLLPALVASSCGAAPIQIGEARFAPRTIEAEGPVVAVGDINRDGKADLVAAGDEISLFEGDGRGGLRPTQRLPAGENPVGLALADIDHNGTVDIVVANHETDYLTLLLGDGKGGFSPSPNSPLRIDVSPHPHVVRAADLDRNGHLDLIVDHRDGHGLLVLPGVGDGRFRRPGLLVPGGGDPYRGMAVGDLDGNGRPDLVTPNPQDVGIVLALGEEEAGDELRFAPPRHLPTVAPFAVELTDLNGDDRLDLIVGSDEEGDEVELFLGNGRGDFTEAPGSPFRLAAGAKTIAVGDFDGNGIQDAVIASYQSSELLILIGGRRGIGTAELWAGEHPWGLAAGDLNGDGKDDLVIGDDARDEAIVYLSRASRE